MKKQKAMQISFRMLTIVMLLAALPFFVLVLSNKGRGKRDLASETHPNSGQGNVLSEPSVQEFIKAFKYDVLRGAGIHKNSKGLGIHLGAFFLNDEKDNKVSICDEYPTLDFIFIADGVAFSGETPQMVVRGPCILDSSNAAIQALTIPFAEIFVTPPEHYDPLDAFSSKQGAQIYFKNIVGSWPREWIWNGVIFYHKTLDKRLEISGYEVISVLGSPLILKANE